MSYIGPQVVNFRPSEDGSWTRDAACTEASPEAMFPTEGDHEGIAEAKRLCGTCLVREACLSDALDRGEQFGIWGGKDPDERRSMKRAAANRRARSK